MTIDEATRLRLRQWFLEHMDSDLADAIMASMPPLEWTKLATKDDLRDTEDRLRAHTELHAARSTHLLVANTIGAAVANMGLLLTALRVG